MAILEPWSLKPKPQPILIHTYNQPLNRSATSYPTIVRSESCKGNATGAGHAAEKFRTLLARCLCFWLLAGVAGNFVWAQKNPLPGYNLTYKPPLDVSAAGTQVVFYKDNHPQSTHVAAPAAFLRAASARLAAPKAQFIVSYTNFTPQAQRAFQYAVDIWASLISSPVPIRIQANWVIDDPNVLGSAGPASYQYSFDGSQQAYSFYPVALAEKIARRELNDPSQPDIVANFNQNNDWYFGTDGKTLKNQTDLVTAVLHELAHGLGMIGFYSVNSQNFGQYLATLPSAYDGFVENGQGERLVASQSKYGNGTLALGSQLTSNNLFANGPVLKRTTGKKLKLSAKTPFSRASSVYHLDEDTYPPGDTNSLMTPLLGLGESIHSPGPLVMQFFSDLGWKTTSVLHTPLPSTEDITDQVFRVRVISDTLLKAGTIQLGYRKSAPTATDSAFVSITLAQVGTTDTYEGTITAAQAQGDIWYFFRAQDASGQTFTNPGKQLQGAQAWYRIHVGPDHTPPTIRYSPSKYSTFAITTTDSLPIYAYMADDLTGIGNAYVDYQINGVAQPALPLRYSRQVTNIITYDSVYTNRIVFPANTLKAGDLITYRLVAQDASRAKNQTISPATGYYQFTVVAQKPVRDQYTNTFPDSTSARDFAWHGFHIANTTNLVDLALHSKHPYDNGTDYRWQTNAECVLLSPIRIKANPDSAFIRFDEIVLVEPGETGSHLGDVGFYDYVVVEGSNTNGSTWQPLISAYNSADKNDWLVAYSLGLVGGAYGEFNSKAVGLPALIRRRTIPLLTAGGPFKVGDQILIRFRLLSDQLSYGWGWVIDNLWIQSPVSPVLAAEPLTDGAWQVYPNPVTTGKLLVEAGFIKPVQSADILVINGTGQVLRQQTYKVGGTTLSEQLDLSQLPAGLYLLRLQTSDSVLTKKIIITK